MNCILLSQHILTEVIDNAKTFASVSKNIKDMKGVESNMRSDACMISGCALRHFNVFKNIIDKAYPELGSEQTNALMIHLANIIFTHTVAKVETIDYCTDVFNKVNITFDYKLFEELTPSNLIDESLDKESAEYFSLRYNVPLWLAKMWLRHYKEKLTYLILKGIHSKMDVYVESIEDSELDVDQFIAKYGDFEKSKFDNLLKYVGKNPLVKSAPFLDKVVFSIRPAVKELMDKVDIDPIRGIAVFQGTNNQYYLDLVSKFSSRVSFDLLCTQGKTYFDTKKTLNNYKLKQVRLYETSADIMNLCISSKVHTFFVFPKCSEFSLLRTTPDYALHFQQENLDALLAEQKLELDKASEIIEDNGYLVYGIPTISKKESHSLINTFLSEHHDFKLIEERQYFPFDKYDSCFYYAILYKGVIDD